MTPSFRADKSSRSRRIRSSVGYEKKVCRDGPLDACCCIILAAADFGGVLDSISEAFWFRSSSFEQSIHFKQAAKENNDRYSDGHYEKSSY